MKISPLRNFHLRSIRGKYLLSMGLLHPTSIVGELVYQTTTKGKLARRCVRIRWRCRRVLQNNLLQNNLTALFLTSCSSLLICEKRKNQSVLIVAVLLQYFWFSLLQPFFLLRVRLLLKCLVQQQMCMGVSPKT